MWVYIERIINIKDLCLQLGTKGDKLGWNPLINIKYLLQQHWKLKVQQITYKLILYKWSIRRKTNTMKTNLVFRQQYQIHTKDSEKWLSHNKRAQVSPYPWHCCSSGGLHGHCHPPPDPCSKGGHRRNSSYTESKEKKTEEFRETGPWERNKNCLLSYIRPY